MNSLQNTKYHIGTAEKVKFLGDRENYPDHPKKVEAFETHMSWVFLTDHLVYKLKKPVKFNSLDFSTLEARGKNCREEVRLNKRLAEEIYLGVVGLTVDRSGKLQLDGQGTVIDWLVKMKRLPANLMLDYCIKHKTFQQHQVEEAASILAKFYRNSPYVKAGSINYIKRLEKELIDTERALLSPDYKLPSDFIKQIVAKQLMFVSQHSTLFGQRIKDNRIIEAHGDLRPEHICLTNPPVFMDCLEFSRELRTLDVAEELSFLSVECELLGAADVGRTFFTIYEQKTGDTIPDILIRFFKSKRACYKARFTIWHIREEQYRNDPKWAARTQAYLALANKYMV